MSRSRPVDILRYVYALPQGSVVTPTDVAAGLGIQISHASDGLAHFADRGLLDRVALRDARRRGYTVPREDLHDKSGLHVYEMLRADHGAIYPFGVTLDERAEDVLGAKLSARSQSVPDFASDAERTLAVEIPRERLRLVLAAASVSHTRLLHEWRKRAIPEPATLSRSPWRRRGVRGPTEVSLKEHDYAVVATRRARNHNASNALRDPAAFPLDHFRVPMADLARSLASGDGLGEYVIAAFGPAWSFHIFATRLARDEKRIDHLSSSECPIHLEDVAHGLAKVGYAKVPGDIHEVSEHRLFERMKQLQHDRAAFVLDAHAAIPAKRIFSQYVNVLNLVDEGVTLVRPHHFRHARMSDARSGLLGFRDAIAGIHDQKLISAGLETTVNRDLVDIVPSIKRL